MKEIIDTLGEFFSSEFAKDNIVIIIGLVILAIAVTASVVSIIFNKLIVPIKLQEAGSIVPDYEKALVEIERLKAENRNLCMELKKYEDIKKMEAAATSEDSEEGFDDGLRSFLK